MFLGEFLDDVNLSIEEVGEKMQKNPFKLLPKMIHISAKTEAELSGEELHLELNDVVKIMEADGGIASPQVVRFINAWTKSMTSGVPQEAAEEGEGEKKK